MTDSTSSLDGRLWNAVNLMNAAFCSAPEASLSNGWVCFYLSPFCIIFHCLFLSYSCSQGAELTLTGLVIKASSLELSRDSAPLGTLYRIAILHHDKVG